jgi:mRNA interferase RelE/StbE
MYRIVIEKYAEKQLAKISPPYFDKIVNAIQSLAENPRPHGYKKLKGRPGYRIRIGDYRVIYKIEDAVLTVYVIDIGNRENIYD